MRSEPNRPEPGPAIVLDVASRTDVGREREQNEDTVLVGWGGQRSVGAFAGWLDVARDAALLAVCDGMGGASAGEVASSAAAEVIHAIVSASPRPARVEELGRRLVDAVTRASRVVHAMGRRRPELDGMGTTATVCVLLGEELVIAQVGDSRAYVLRGGALFQLTRDQTLTTMLVERGQLRPEEAETFPHGHVILQAVGASESVDVDLRSVSARRGDVLLLCSDGLSGAVGAERLRDELASGRTVAAIADRLVRIANEAGGRDNVTCIVARVAGGGAPAPRRDEAPRAAHLVLSPQSPEPRSSVPPEAVARPGATSRLRAWLCGE